MSFMKWKAMQDRYCVKFVRVCEVITSDICNPGLPVLMQLTNIHTQNSHPRSINHGCKIDHRRSRENNRAGIIIDGGMIPAQIELLLGADHRLARLHRFVGRRVKNRRILTTQETLGSVGRTSTPLITIGDGGGLHKEFDFFACRIPSVPRESPLP
ncbi:hypothetical protein POX_b03407 [Penicillium oxalicum]|uniref:hypothetical protein n=1 Tax=Penicillium oxalicum TaxID=69781 RepID=UPI0020B6391E|nr:hypothetical protein POX_b03407 [Penicillium oxalicum]KAI2793353.1 hypothetical protein POX_b03407 [Penicillium oxalicum]